ncbi:hypothetical protein HBH69_098950 [Parastagonospora nodorum]|nr:hypothetical protein HBH69_098950 [Parastagonospora nodorum]
MHICAADSLSSTIIVYNYIKKDKNADLAIANSILDALDIPNYVNIFSLDFAFSFANILLLIAFIISYYLFADKLNIQQSLLDRVTVVLIIILRSTPSTLLARFIPITKIRNPLLKTNYEEQVLLTSIKKNRYCTRYTVKHYNFNIYISLAIDTLHLLLKGLVIKMLDFMQDILDDIYPSKQKAIIQQLIAVISLLFISKAPFALYFIYIVYDLHALTYIIQDIRIYRALNSICTRANSKAHYITIVKQFYSIINKKDEVAANIAISNFIYAAALYLILIIINYTCYDKDRKHIAYIKAFSKVLLFNNNRQINNTTRILSILQAFKFYDLSMIICLVHLVPRDLPNLITYTTMSYYVNNYIN